MDRWRVQEDKTMIKLADSIETWWEIERYGSKTIMGSQVEKEMQS